MMPVIAISNLDLIQATRWMRWVGFLSSISGTGMLSEKILIVFSRRAARHSRSEEICRLAKQTFGEAICHVPDSEHESGWPGSANWMFVQCLTFMEQHCPDQDILFIEPDCVPVTPDWLDKLNEEWLAACLDGKSFMGARVPYDIPHMTGNAVYGRKWRSLAPSLVTCPDTNAWDVFSAQEVMPHALFTDLIQHVFRRHEPGWRVPSLEVLHPKAVLFHQDKKGNLIRLLDEQRYGGQCAHHPLYGYAQLDNPDFVMTKFYYASNATKSVKSHGKKFAFDALQAFGGSVPGVLSLDTESDQLAMADVVANAANGVTEITQAEYEAATKKKWVPQNSSTSVISAPRLPQLPINPLPKGNPAVLVAEPIPVAGEVQAPGAVIPKSIDEVLKMDTVVPAQPAIATPGKRPRKPQG